MMDENKGLLNSRHRESEDLVPAHRQRQHWACCSDCPSPSLGNQSRYPTSSFFSVTYLVTLHLLCLLLSAYLLSTWIRLSERQASPLLGRHQATNSASTTYLDKETQLIELITAQISTHATQTGSQFPTSYSTRTC